MLRRIVREELRRRKTGLTNWSRKVLFRAQRLQRIDARRSARGQIRRNTTHHKHDHGDQRERAWITTAYLEQHRFQETAQRERASQTGADTERGENECL